MTPSTRPQWSTPVAVVALLVAALATSGALAQEKAGGQKFKDWTVRCEQFKDKDGGATKQCHMFQDWHHKERKLRILHVAIAFPPKREGAVAVLTMPLGIYLPLGVKLQIDKGKSIKFPVERCETWPAGKDKKGVEHMDGGCKAGLGLKPETLASLRKGSKAFVTFHDMRRTPVTVPVSLSGFTAGLRALQ